MRCNKIKTKRIVKNKRLQDIEKFRFQNVLYKKVNSNKNLVKKTIKKDLQKSINTILIVKTTIKISNIKCLIIEFSCVVKVQLTNTIV